MHYCHPLQANTFAGLTHVAGAIPLLPATMAVVSPDARLQALLAAANAQAVAIAAGSCMFSAHLSTVVYMLSSASVDAKVGRRVAVTLRSIAIANVQHVQHMLCSASVDAKRALCLGTAQHRRSQCPNVLCLASVDTEGGRALVAQPNVPAVSLACAAGLLRSVTRPCHGCAGTRLRSLGRSVAVMHKGAVQRHGKPHRRLTLRLKEV